MTLDIYQENILDHYQNPRNFGHIKNPDLKAHDSNPLCGDSFDIELKIKNNKIEEVRFSGHGCAISTAAASMLSEELKGKKVEEALKIEKEDILRFLGVELSHVRIKCAMLSLKVLKLALYQKNTKKQNLSVKTKHKQKD